MINFGKKNSIHFFLYKNHLHRGKKKSQKGATNASLRLFVQHHQKKKKTRKTNGTWSTGMDTRVNKSRIRTSSNGAGRGQRLYLRRRRQVKTRTNEYYLKKKRSIMLDPLPNACLMGWVFSIIGTGGMIGEIFTLLTSKSTCSRYISFKSMMSARSSSNCTVHLYDQG